MDFRSFSVVVGSLQAAAAHVMDADQFAAFTESIQQMRTDGLPPLDIVDHLIGALKDEVRKRKDEVRR